MDPASKRASPRGRRSAGARAGGGLRVLVSDGRGRTVRDGGLSRWLEAAAPARSRGDVAIALVTDGHITRLNQQYRHKNTPTDVLSFPSDPRTPDPGSRIPDPGSRIPDPGSRIPDPGSRIPDGGSRQRSAHLGDIVIAKGVARRQAREAGHSYATELRLLALHGLLHLLGYDHHAGGDAGRMARTEARLRRRAGLPAGLIERANTGTIARVSETGRRRTRKTGR